MTLRKETRCECCGTPVKVVGTTTMHYEPIWKDWVKERLEKMLSKIPARDGQKKNVLTLMQNWKESINDMESLITELSKEIKGE